MVAKTATAYAWSSLVSVETYRNEPSTRHVVPRIETLSQALQRHPSAGTLTPVLVMRGSISDEGDEGYCTVKTFARTDHTNRSVLVELDIISESRGGLAPRRQVDRPFLVTVQADPFGASFASGPYRVLVRSPEGRPLAQGELVFSDGG